MRLYVKIKIESTIHFEANYLADEFLKEFGDRLRQFGNKTQLDSLKIRRVGGFGDTGEFVLQITSVVAPLIIQLYDSVKGRREVRRELSEIRKVREALVQIADKLHRRLNAPIEIEEVTEVAHRND